MKKLNVLLVILFVVFLPITLLLTDVQLVAYNRDYYRDEYIKYKVPEHIGMSLDNLMASTEKLLLYLEDKREDLNFTAEFTGGTKEFFSQRDKDHMVDVKGLFMKGYFLRNIALLYIVGFLLLLFFNRNNKDKLRKLAKYGMAVAAAGIIPVIILVVLMNLDFYKYFTIFHEIFFTNDLWLLDPAVDRLVNIFPEQFFTDMAFSIAYLYIAEMAVILVGSIFTLRYGKNKSR